MTLRLRNTLTRPVEPVEPLEPGPGPDVHLRPDRLPLRPRRQPAQLPAGRPHPARPAVPRPRRPPRQEHHRRRPPARRAVRPRRGPDARRRPASRTRRPAEIADAYEAAFHADEAAVNILPAHVFPRATEHIPEMLELAEALEDAGHAYALRRRQRLLRGRVVRRLRPAVGQHARRPAGRPPRRGRARQARPGRLRAVEGGRRGPARSSGRPRAGARASRAGTSSARRWPCATSGDRFDIHTGGIDNVFPHHEDEIAQSAPIVGGPPATLLGPRRAPADGGPEDGQVGRQLPAGHRAGRARHRSARVPLPRR